MYFKKMIVDAGKRLASSNLTVETWGNISYRDSSTQTVYLTPSAMPYSAITEDDVVVCSLDGSIIDTIRKPTIEKDLHLEIYKSRPDVNAIVHTHAIFSTVFAAQEKDIPIIIDEAAQALGGVVRCAKYALPGSIDLAYNVRDALGQESNAALVHSHGAVCVGKDMNTAFKVATVLEMTAEIYYMIEASGGKAIGISPENVAAMKELMKHYGQGK